MGVGFVVFDKSFTTVEMYQSSVLSPLLFAIVMDVVKKDARNGVLYEILYAGDLVLMSESIEDLQRKRKTHTGKQRNEGHQLKQNIINGEWNKRRNVIKQNRSVWQKSNG